MATSERVEFRGSSGAMLAARLDHPEGAARGWALFAHCFTCSKDHVASTRIARALALTGIGVLRFDFTGLGSSDGDFANTNFSSNIEDLVLAADWLRTAHAAPVILIGHSLGGAAVIAAADRVPEATAVATLGAPADPAHVTALFASARAELDEQGEATVSLAGRSFKIRKQLLADLEASKIEAALGSLRRALLVLHSPRDNIVGIDHAARIFAAARHPKSFISLDDADHLLTRPDDASYVAQVIATWAARFLPAPAPPPTAADDGEVVVRETRDGRFTQAIAAGPHALHADEPPGLGGEDRGPSPYGFLLAALGACTSMTLRMYAERKQLPLERVTVRLRHKKIHAQDCETCETKVGKIDHIDRLIELEGPLDDAQRARLLEIANMCPVHRTLESEIKISSQLAPAE